MESKLPYQFGDLLFRDVPVMIQGQLHLIRAMWWLRLVGSLKLYVSFAEYAFFYRALLQKRPIILRSLVIIATPYLTPMHQSRDLLLLIHLWIDWFWKLGWLNDQCASCTRIAHFMNLRLGLGPLCYRFEGIRQKLINVKDISMSLSHTMSMDIRSPKSVADPSEMPLQSWYNCGTNRFHQAYFCLAEMKKPTMLSNKRSNA